jgi:hypothetical protein
MKEHDVVYFEKKMKEMNSCWGLINDDQNLYSEVSVKHHH